MKPYLPKWERSQPSGRSTDRASALVSLANLRGITMNTRRSHVVAGLACSMLLVVNAFASQAEDDAIREVQTRQAAAWNANDAEAYAGLFAEDGEVVNVLGWWWRGRAEIRSKLSEAFAWVFRDSHLAITAVHTRFLDPSTAIAHVRWTLDGAKAPPGAPAPPREGIQLQVLRKTGDQWLIVSFQNTNSVPEQPFPQGPPADRER
jgi:uncharacterized protein (TIGR02246 family)